MFRLCLGFLVCAQLAWAAAPTIPNRDPQPGEMGYRPADGSLVTMNPPSLLWLHEPNVARYEVAWSRDAQFTSASVATNLPFNTYTHNATLAPGVYYWRYRGFTSNQLATGWSRVRSFEVKSGTVEFPMPSRLEQKQRLPANHPRLFLRPEDLPKMRAAVKPGAGEAAPIFAALRKEADQIIKSPPVPEPTVRGSIRDPATRDQWWPNRTTSEKACAQAETLAFVYLLTGEQKYGVAARERILHLARWDPDGPTNFRLNCEAAKPIIYRLPRAYDWAYDALTEPDREIVRQVMRRRGLDAWNSGEMLQGTGHLTRPYNSHGNRIWHKMGELAIAHYGEFPEAETWLDYAVNKFYACYPVWCDDDGGWHEGASYWSGYMGKVINWLLVCDSALQIDGLKKPFFAQIGDFPLYAAPPNSPNMGFGDLSYAPPKPATFLEYFFRAAPTDLSRSHAPYWLWRNQALGAQPTDGILGVIYNARLGPLPQPRPPVDLPPSKVFRGIGVASLHSTLTNALNDVHVLFKSSPFGSQSHGHNPQNSFQLNAYGDALLTACVYRDWHGSPFHYKWVHDARAQNSVLVDGQGPLPHSAASTGAIVDFGFSPSMDFVTGSATNAYGGRLTRALRTIAFVKPDLIVICDDLVATNDVSFQFMLHGLAEFQVDPAKATLRIAQKRASAKVQYLSPEPLRFRQWDGYDPAPEREFPNQWHVEAATQGKRRELQVITVIDPRPTGVTPAFEAEYLESRSAVGARITRDGKILVVGFKRPGEPGPAALPTLTFKETVGLKIQ